MASGGSGHSAGAFDIRTVIALLFAIYGVVLIVLGFIQPDAELEKSAGLNINLWSGVAMVLFAAVFIAWARLRPIVVPDDVDGGSTEG
ncbi:hypothetical protein EIL87_23200 [Saccharopolyspora rhizosphaerae]|uniref:Uncharacterized protein n=1 Tax=Saccharopolyspora rhizosphaerae TaxID=2492662 RepID=A0A3R8QHG5_9PSEU|nr:hypothetical protein [Saccharopolyspora rhizosphaerae]RRO12619.1 hypothetical protein EIL87_23200 [Saccharopolyspora rhizosphaerae]